MSALMPLFDPVSEACLGFKQRADIHRDGDWHRGVQAFVVRRAGASFDVLVQKRSAAVDIGGQKYDQSLATQMTADDGLSEEETLRRGLKEELGITDYRCIRVPATLRIVKTYEDDVGAYNRELISLFIVESAEPLRLAASCPKITELQWMPWKSFLSFFHRQRDRFTKTGQFYLAEQRLRHLAAEQSRFLLGIRYHPVQDVGVRLQCVHYAHAPQIISPFTSSSLHSHEAPGTVAHR